MKLDSPSLRALPSLLARNAAEDPDRVFLSFQDGEYTRGQVWERSQRIASGLLNLDLQHGERIAVMLDNGPDFVLTWFGLATAGLVQVPMNPEMGRARLLHAMRNSQASAVVVDVRYLDQFVALKDELPALRLAVTVGREMEQGPFEFRSLASLEKSEISDIPVISFADTTAIMYTSGSTGPAKGVIVSHGQHYANGWQSASQAEILADDRIFIALPLHHNQAQGYGLMTAVVSGASVFIATGFNRKTFWDEVNEAKATAFVFVGALLALLGGQKGSVENSIRVAYGSMAPQELLLEIEERFGMRIIDAYGSTEATIPIWGSARGDRVIGSSGRLIEGMELTIRDENDIAVPAGTTGEVCIRSIEPFAMSQGYFNNFEKTVKAWRNFWYHSGDRGRLDKEGNFWFEGRLDDAIRRFGEFVSDKEVEDAILTLDAVALVACYGITDPVAGQEVMVAIILREDRTLSAEDVRARTAELLPPFAVPRYVEVLDEFPMTPTGKIEKHKLRSRGVTEMTYDARQQKIANSGAETIAPAHEPRRVRMRESIESVRELPPTLSGQILEQWIDLNHHLNVNHFFRLLSEASIGACEPYGLGLDQQGQHNTGMVSVSHHVNYLREIRLGEEYSLHVRLIAASSKGVHQKVYLANDSTSTIAATLESILLNLDLASRRIVDFREEARHAVLVDLRHQADLTWEPELCGNIGLRGELLPCSSGS